MKKKVPNIINVPVDADAEFYDELFLLNIDNIYIKKGYSLSKNDFYRYCGILLSHPPVEGIPTSLENNFFLNGELHPKIRYEKIQHQKNANLYTSEDDILFFHKYIFEKLKERKEIIRNEIKKVGINPDKVWKEKSEYLRRLIKVANNFSDEVTLIPWFIPIKLTFEKFIHIYVKHAEETKFANGAFTRRTFFDYEFDEIWVLLKAILNQEKESIQDHFLEVSAARILKEEYNVKSYHRGFKNFAPIIFNADKFAISIDKNGFIVKFHQIK